MPTSPVSARWVPFLESTGAKMVDQRHYPKLYRLIQKLEADPAVIFAHAIEDEKPVTSSPVASKVTSRWKI